MNNTEDNKKDGMDKETNEERPKAVEPNGEDPTQADVEASKGDVEATQGDEPTQGEGPEKGRITSALIFAIGSCTMSSFLFGYNIGVVNSPAKLVQSWINESHYGMFHSQVSMEQNDFIWSVAVAIFSLGGMIGGLLSGFVADRFGRRGGMLLNNAFAFIAAAMMAFTKLSDSYFLLIFGRLFIGFASGVFTGLSPMYLTEISPMHLRGAVGSLHQLAITVAILVSQIMSLDVILGTVNYWPLLFALTALPAIVQVITMPFCPESPKYTLVIRGLDAQAEKDLRKLRGKIDVHNEMDNMREEDAKIKSVPKVLFLDMFKNPLLRWPLFIAAMMMLSQQLSGINVAMYYSDRVFRDAGLSGREAMYATIGMGTINVLMTVVSVALVERAGRRTLHMTGLGGMAIVSIALVVMLTIQNAGQKWASILCVILVMLFVIAFATGPGSIPWFYVSELFNSGARGHANSVAVATNWSANLFVGLIFLPLNNTIKQYSFLVFTFFLVFFLLFTWKFVPETKNVPMAEIEEKIRLRYEKKK